MLSEFEGNKANGVANDIYNEGILNLATSVDGKIIFNCGISSNNDTTKCGTINIGNDVNSNLGSIILNSTVSNQNVNLNNGTLQVGTTSNVFNNVNLTMDGGTLNSINNQVGGKAGNVDLASVEMKHGYIQYGVGVTKTWKDRLNSFFQIVFRNGGRTGVGFQLGLNYSFDWTNPFKSKSKTKSKSELKNNSNPKPQKTIIKAMTVAQRTAYKHKDSKTVFYCNSLRQTSFIL